MKRFFALSALVFTLFTACGGGGGPVIIPPNYYRGIAAIVQALDGNHSPSFTTTCWDFATISGVQYAFFSGTLPDGTSLGFLFTSTGLQANTLYVNSPVIYTDAAGSTTDLVTVSILSVSAASAVTFTWNGGTKIFPAAYDGFTIPHVTGCGS